MPNSLFPSDDSLPTCLHTALLVLIVAPLVGFFLWYGVGAIATARLEPLSGPEFGQWLFGNAALSGRPAVIAGFSLLLDAASFLALAFRFSRYAAATSVAARIAPWALLALASALAFVVRR